MPILLNIPPIRQLSPNSCWWACMQMVLSYSGRNFASPWDLNPVFMPRYNPGLPRVQSPPYLAGETIGQYAEDPRRWERHTILHPSEWYQRGVPMTARGLRYLQQLTGFEGLPSRPAFGSWTTDLVEEKLRQHGPYIFIGNWNGQGFHAILVIGREQNQRDEVVYIDPAMGRRMRVAIRFFNNMMSSVGVQTGNPLIFPRASQRLRARMDEPIRR
ncbi:MAG: papain-like cysteine protease family protein [Bacteroidota bacterium]